MVLLAALDDPNDRPRMLAEAYAGVFAQLAAETCPDLDELLRRELTGSGPKRDVVDRLVRAVARRGRAMPSKRRAKLVEVVGSKSVAAADALSRRLGDRGAPGSRAR